MVEIFKSATLDRWLKELRHPGAKARIETRIRRLGLGNPGHVDMAEKISRYETADYLETEEDIRLYLRSLPGRRRTVAGRRGLG